MRHFVHLKEIYKHSPEMSDERQHIWVTRIAGIPYICASPHRQASLINVPKNFWHLYTKLAFTLLPDKEREREYDIVLTCFQKQQQDESK